MIPMIGRQNHNLAVFLASESRMCPSAVVPPNLFGAPMKHDTGLILWRSSYGLRPKRRAVFQNTSHMALQPMMLSTWFLHVCLAN